MKTGTKSIQTADPVRHGGMVRRMLLVGLAAGFLPMAAMAQVAGQAVPQPPETAPLRDDRAMRADLLRGLAIQETLAIMREEGLAYGRELEATLFPEAGGARWQAEVERVYDSGRMTLLFTEALAEALPQEHVAESLAFFGSPLGQRIVGLEVSAREALLDDAVEEASRAALRDLRRQGGPRLEALRGFIAAGDLLEANVAGALNTNLAFFQGLGQGGAFPAPMTEEQMLTEVWSQEAAIRTETEDWLYSYLAMAYQPLTDAELAAYTAFSLQPAGEALNRALFAAFDQMFTQISRELGRGAARIMSGQDI